MEAHSFSFFAVGEEPTSLRDLNIDEKGEPVRKRQRHTKSRNGCANCKKRKVKCDEARPSCLGCEKRGLCCDLPSIPASSGQKSSIPIPISVAEKDSTTLEILADDTNIMNDGLDHTFAPIIPSKADMILRRSPAEEGLVQHFEKSTSDALSWASSTWYLGVLDNAQQCEYLMSAVMLVAASHINYYLPKNDPARRPFLHHFLHALSGLRKALTEEVTAATFEAIFGCSILLIHHSWSYIDTDLGDGTEIAAHFRETVALFHGLKDCVMAYQPVLWETSIGPLMSYSPKATLEEYIRGKESSERKFTKTMFHCMMCPLRNCPKGCSADNYSAVQRLSVPLHAIIISQTDTERAKVDYDIRRYLFTWPTLCTDGFVQQLKENQPTSLLILLYYYAGILSITSERSWFMKDRALFMYRNLLAELGGVCETCTAPALALYNEVPIADPISSV